jgi:hypothetical protein
MNLNSDQKNALEKLYLCRDSILQNVEEIQSILKQHFPEEYSIAYQFWIPQIITALYNHNRWLNRCDQNMEQTISRLITRDDFSKGVSKYIK